MVARGAPVVETGSRMTRPETGTKRKVVGLPAFARRGVASRAKLAAAFSMLRRCIAFSLWADHPETSPAHRHRDMPSPCRPQRILKVPNRPVCGRIRHGQILRVWPVPTGCCVRHAGWPTRNRCARSRACVLLRTLVSQPGVLITKSALMDAAWPGLAVEEGNLTVQISALRRTLADAPGGSQWIGTVARRGYRFIGEVQETDRLLAPRVNDIGGAGPARRTAHRLQYCRSRMPEATPRRAMSATALPRTSSSLCHGFQDSSSSPQTLRSATGGTGWTSERSPGSSACNTWSRAAFGTVEIASASRSN